MVADGSNLHNIVTLFENIFEEQVKEKDAIADNPLVDITTYTMSKVSYFKRMETCFFSLFLKANSIFRAAKKIFKLSMPQSSP